MNIDEDDFNQLLSWLGPDREKGAQKYESIRRNLITIFSRRGCHLAEDLVDKAFDQVMHRLSHIIGTYRGEPARYIYITAHHLFLDYRKQQSHSVPMPAEFEIPSASVPDPEDERIFDCLQQCLQRLSPENRRLFLAYHQKEKGAKIEHRKMLAREMGIALNALRIRAFRIRADLEICINRCCEQCANSRNESHAQPLSD